MSNVIAASVIVTATIAAVRGDKITAVGALLGELAQLYANNGGAKDKLHAVAAGIRAGRKSISQNTLAGRVLETLAAIESTGADSGARPAKGRTTVERDTAAEAFALGIVGAFEGIMQADNEARKAQRDARPGKPAIVAAPVTSEGEDKARAALSATVAARDALHVECEALRAQLADMTAQRDNLVHAALCHGFVVAVNAERAEFTPTGEVVAA